MTRVPRLPSIRLVRLLVAASLVTSFAHGEPSAQDKAQADAFFREGRALMTDAKYALACAKFAESHRLDPAPGTLVNLALCHEKDGQTASAWAEFNEVAERPGDDKARGPYARGRAQELEKRLSRLRVKVAAPSPSESVAIDGRTQGAGAWGSALPLDPGEHVVVASAPGRKSWKSTVRLGQGPTVLDVDVPALEDPPREAALLSPPPPPASKSPTDGSTQRTVGLAVGGAGIVAIGVGAAFGLRTLGKKSDADAICPSNKCAGDPRVADLDDAAKTSAVVSTLAFAVGAVAVAAGVTLVLSAPRFALKTAGLTIAPVASPGAGGVGVGGAIVSGRF